MMKPARSLQAREGGGVSITPPLSPFQPHANRNLRFTIQLTSGQRSIEKHLAAAAKDNRYEYITAGESTLETKSPLAAYINRTNVIDKVRERGGCGLGSAG